MIRNTNEEYIKAIGFIRSYSLVILLFLMIYATCIYVYDIKITNWISITNLGIMTLLSGWAYWKASKRKKRYEDEQEEK